MYICIRRLLVLCLSMQIVHASRNARHAVLCSPLYTQVVVYHGSPEKRESLYNESVSSTRKHGDVARFNVLLTTYEYLMGKNDRPRLTRYVSGVTLDNACHVLS